MILSSINFITLALLPPLIAPLLIYIFKSSQNIRDSIGVIGSLISFYATINITKELIESVKENMDELPEEKQDRFMSSYNLNEYDAGVICADKKIANFFEEVVKNADVELAAKWIIGDLNALLNKHDMDLEESKIDAENFSELIQKITDNTISGKIAKEVLEEMWNTGAKVTNVIDSKGMQQISDVGELEKIIETILNENTDQVNAYKSGKDKLFGFFVGQVMKVTQGKANPGLVNELLKKKLS